MKKLVLVGLMALAVIAAAIYAYGNALWESELFGALVGLLVLAPIAPYVLACLNVGFTFVREGEAKFVMKGDSYVRTILSLKGHTLDQEGNIVKGDPPEPQGLKRRFLTWVERAYGAYWVGVPFFRRLHRYQLRWMAYEPAEEGGEKRPVVKSRDLDSTFAKDKLYYGKALSVETEERLPIDVEFLITLRVVNPYLAIFTVANWIEAIIDRTTQQVRVYVGGKTYQKLIEGEKYKLQQGFSGHMQKALAKTARDLYGVEFVSCDILSLNPPKEFRDLTLKTYEATQKGEATKTEAEAKAYAIEKVGKAEAQSLRDRAKAFEDHPEASKAQLDAEVGKATGIKAIVSAFMAGIAEVKKGGGNA